MELLVVLGILPIVIGGVAVAMISSFSSAGAVTSRVNDSHDAQITSAYFTRDVQGASLISTSTTHSICPSATTGPQLLGLRWFSGGTPISITYALSTNTSSAQLMRSYCAGAAAPVTTVAVNNAFTGLASPTVSNACAAGVSSCATSATHTNVMVLVQCLSGGNACANSGLTSTFPSAGSPNQGVSSVTIEVTESTSGYRYTLSASPRNQASQILLPPGSAGPPLVLVGSSNPALSCSNKSGVTVNGAVAVDSSQPNSIQFNGNSSGLQATELYTEPIPSPGVPVQPANKYTGPITPGPAFPDPYSGLPDPTASTVYPPSTTSIVGPGEYTSPAGVSVTGSLALPPGVYIFDHGLSVSGTNGTTLSGTGVMFFIGIPNAAPDAPQDATYSVSGNGTIAVTAPITGTYAGISIMQARTDTHLLNISGNGANNTYGGVIYAPGAAVNASGNGSVATGSIVAGSLTCGGNGGVSIGFAVITSAPQTNPIVSGGTEADVTNVIGVPGLGAPEGAISFYVCGPSVAPGSCTSADWSAVGLPVTLSPGAAEDTSTATSASAAYSTPGTWCFVEVYNPSGHPNYGASSDTSTDGCFVVNGPGVTATFPTSAGSPYKLNGNSSWNSSDPCIQATGDICGTATDTAGATITGVQFSLQQTASGNVNSCWIPGTSTWTAGACSSYSATALGAPVASVWPWWVAFNQSHLTSGDTYLLTLVATDSLGLQSTTTVSFSIS
jgi:hypothetical protein